jgi:RNA polymerase sigma factor (sigma-70 family)
MQRTEQSSWTGLVARFERRLLGYLRRHAVRRADLEDLAQEVWVRAISAMERFDPQRGDEWSLLVTIAKRVLIDRQHKSCRVRWTWGNTCLQGDAAGETRPVLEQLVQREDAVHRVECVVEAVRSELASASRTGRDVLRRLFAGEGNSKIAKAVGWGERGDSHGRVAYFRWKLRRRLVAKLEAVIQ